MKQRISWIKPDDLEGIIKSCDRDKEDNYLVPETLEIYVVPTKEERIRMRIDELEKEWKTIPEPTKEELVEEGITVNQHHEIIRQIKYWKSKL